MGAAGTALVKDDQIACGEDRTELLGEVGGERDCRLPGASRQTDHRDPLAGFKRRAVATDRERDRPRRVTRPVERYRQMAAGEVVGFRAGSVGDRALGAIGGGYHTCQQSEQCANERAGMFSHYLQCNGHWERWSHIDPQWDGGRGLALSWIETLGSLSVSQEPRVINSTDAPAAIGPYNQAVAAGGLLFCSGQIPLDPHSGELVGTSAAEQAGRCLENLSAVCEAAETSLSRALRLTVYMTDLAHFADVGEVYASFFDAQRAPARVTIGVAALPRGAQVEIDAIVAL